MEPLFQQLVVGLVPQPTQVPPTPFDRDDLQRLFGEVGRDYSYAQLQLLPGDIGAQYMNTPDDVVLVQPGLVQIRTPVMTTQAATDKAVSVLRAAARRLNLSQFLACGIKVIAHVPAPGTNPDAKSFVTERLLNAGDQARVLGPNFFGGGIKYRSIDDSEPIEEVLLIEPFVRDNTRLFVDYDVQRQLQFRGLDNVASWIAEAFTFVTGPTMEILEVDGA